MKIMLRILTIALPFASCSNDDDVVPGNGLSIVDIDFMAKAATGNKNEVLIGALAPQSGRDTAIRWFGSMMVMDHNAAYDELSKVASGVSTILPMEADSAHNALKLRLQSLSGYSFDTAYIQSQVKDHNEAVTLYQHEIDSGSHASVKAYAVQILPKVKMHLATADSIAALLRP
ncbi:putative membrane protein [Chitinophaga jiangningensis]|uniref:Putative membrane protein n=1 Tax=Chitinophaga jiangningensis TaxID=1419482 RepID=A0A1M7DKR1_9BACT|nr:DUF4142 domain-containing protein [Chitinophaga jiangningensis]SHL80062.1 putative membrane protein [Chitinophaga jiangningensis]